MAKTRKKTMSREEANELYNQLRRNMAGYIQREKAEKTKTSGVKSAAKPKPAAAVATPPRQTPVAPSRSAPLMRTSRPGFNRGHLLGVGLVVSLGLFKVVLSGLEAAGIWTVEPAQASVATQPAERGPLFKSSGQGFVIDKEQMRLLTSLDARRSELEDKNRRLDEREADLKRRDAEFALRLTEIRELTDRLKIDREKNDKKRETQLGQLANFYGSMNPQEAAALIEQLDVTIALNLLERMPEKRIGQILALMSPERALTITRMLSGK